MTAKVIFRGDILNDKWGMSSGDVFDYWALLVHYGWVDAADDEKADIELMCEWGDEANA